MTKLLILCEFPTLSGGERSMLATIDGVGQAGFDVHLMAPSDGPLAEVCRARQIPLVPFPTKQPVAPVKLSLAQRREDLAEQLARLRPDLLHANSLSMGRLAGPVAAELRVPSVAYLRDIIKVSRQVITDLNKNTRLLAVSDATRRLHVAAGLDGEKTFTLYNGVDLEEFYPRAPSGYLHRELGISTGVPLIGTIGQIGLRKGQEILLGAARLLGAGGILDADADRGLPPSAIIESCMANEPRVTNGSPVFKAFRDNERFNDNANINKSSYPLPAAYRLPPTEAHWLIIGERWSDKQESREFERQLHVQAEQLDGRVHFLGVRTDVSKILPELTLLVHPARQEPLGRVLLEAAGAGTPVVATDVGGTSEIFPTQTGSARLVEPDNAQALAEAIAELLGDPEARRRMSTAARRRAEQQFDAVQSTAGLIEHYRALAE